MYFFHKFICFVVISQILTQNVASENANNLDSKEDTIVKDGRRSRIIIIDDSGNNSDGQPKTHKVETKIYTKHLDDHTGSGSLQGLDSGSNTEQRIIQPKIQLQGCGAKNNELSSNGAQASVANKKKRLETFQIINNGGPDSSVTSNQNQYQLGQRGVKVVHLLGQVNGETEHIKPFEQIGQTRQNNGHVGHFDEIRQAWQVGQSGQIGENDGIGQTEQPSGQIWQIRHTSKAVSSNGSINPLISNETQYQSSQKGVKVGHLVKGLFDEQIGQIAQTGQIGQTKQLALQVGQIKPISQIKETGHNIESGHIGQTSQTVNSSDSVNPLTSSENQYQSGQKGVKHLVTEQLDAQIEPTKQQDVQIGEIGQTWQIGKIRQNGESEQIGESGQIRETGQFGQIGNIKITVQNDQIGQTSHTANDNVSVSPLALNVNQHQSTQEGKGHLIMGQLNGPIGQIGQTELIGHTFQKINSSSTGNPLTSSGSPYQSDHKGVKHLVSGQLYQEIGQIGPTRQLDVQIGQMGQTGQIGESGHTGVIEQIGGQIGNTKVIVQNEQNGKTSQTVNGSESVIPLMSNENQYHSGQNGVKERILVTELHDGKIRPTWQIGQSGQFGQIGKTEKFLQPAQIGKTQQFDQNGQFTLLQGSPTHTAISNVDETTGAIWMGTSQGAKLKSIHNQHSIFYPDNSYKVSLFSTGDGIYANELKEKRTQNGQHPHNPINQQLGSSTVLGYRPNIQYYVKHLDASGKIKYPAILNEPSFMKYINPDTKNIINLSEDQLNNYKQYLIQTGLIELKPYQLIFSDQFKPNLKTLQWTVVPMEPRIPRNALYSILSESSSKLPIKLLVPVLKIRKGIKKTVNGIQIMAGGIGSIPSALQSAFTSESNDNNESESTTTSSVS